ncbi:hypothetical protein DKM44_06465 [Deinococcus irradiatisoli]|uniref:DUF2178 domain-containing protein n=1 Tax=Deinococcus irradiatisoli TaxID=2202254 RepID=A0A2Z3JCM6_9DEIO|nr:hypothetical protein [Deinococcus irradiatisoli]AWN22913.1 hypothetical protein DKM44_06465 [Deinococcus irradiatisoli]
MMAPTSRKSTTNRERRVWQTMWGMLGSAAAIGVIGLAVGLLKARTQGDTHDFLNGMTLGLLGSLPVAMGVWLFRAYRQMDEFGQRQQERACAFAFLVSMVAIMVAFAVSSFTGVQVPLWGLYVFGMLVYSAAVVRGAVLARSGR